MEPTHAKQTPAKHAPKIQQMWELLPIIPLGVAFIFFLIISVCLPMTGDYQSIVQASRALPPEDASRAAITVAAVIMAGLVFGRLVETREANSEHHSEAELARARAANAELAAAVERRVREALEEAYHMERGTLPD